MEFSFITRAKSFFGEGCVERQSDNWILGSRAYIMTGANSGRLSGALDDVTKTLKEKGVPYEVFEGVENNPSVEQCMTLTLKAREFSADFIIGIGGGSPIDAAKAVAVLFDPNVSVDDMFANNFKSALPLVAIPTTSGTGSEVTPWSVLTRHNITNKQSFGNFLTIPAVALLDPSYTRSLSSRVTIDTAIDALAHCVEGILSLKSSPVSDAFAMQGLRILKSCLGPLENGDYEHSRGELMLASMFGGMTIAHTGTTMIHAMGYPLTYFKGLSHGEANAFIMLSALRLLNDVAKERTQLAFSPLCMSVDDFIDYLLRTMPFKLHLSDEEIASFTTLTMPQGALRNTPCELNEAKIREIYASAQSASNFYHIK